MTLNDVRKWRVGFNKWIHGTNVVETVDWLIAEVGKLEKVRKAWLDCDPEADESGWGDAGWHLYERMRDILSDGKPKCTCEDGSGIICGHHWREALDAIDRDKQPESPQNVTAPADWFSGYLELKGLFMALERSKDDWGSALEKRIEALDLGLREHAKVALDDSMDLRYRVKELEK